jgi:hypothetical protein
MFRLILPKRRVATLRLTRRTFYLKSLPKRKQEKQFLRFFSPVSADAQRARFPQSTPPSIPAGAQRLLSNSQLRLDLIA